MSIVLGIFFFWLVVLGGYKIIKYQMLKGKPSTPELKNYSWPSKQLIAEYKALPDEHKSFGNIEDMVAALDIKYDVQEVNKHFLNYYNDSPSWNCYNLSHYSHATCGKYREYHDLHDNIADIQSAIKKRAHALQVAGVAHSINAIEELNDHLRKERKLVEDVTKELTS